ncbi:hypothetical protein ACXYMU_00665 [Pontibacter sp. CAU 1760]
MHHNEQDPRHSHHRDLRHRREQHPEQFERERYFNDFKSRWGEPLLPLHLHPNNSQSRDIGRFGVEGDFHRQHEEWLPNQRRPHYPQQQQHSRDTSWRQRDVNFDRNNQRAEDRWMQDETIPHPDDRRRRRQGLPDRDGRDNRHQG